MKDVDVENDTKIKDNLLAKRQKKDYLNRRRVKEKLRRRTEVLIFVLFYIEKPNLYRQ